MRAVERGRYVCCNVQKIVRMEFSLCCMAQGRRNTHPSLKRGPVAWAFGFILDSKTGTGGIALMLTFSSSSSSSSRFASTPTHPTPPQPHLPTHKSQQQQQPQQHQQ